jgi:hypothetical protein
MKSLMLLFASMLPAPAQVAVNQIGPTEYAAVVQVREDVLVCIVSQLSNGQILYYCLQQLRGVTSVPPGGLGVLTPPVSIDVVAQFTHSQGEVMFYPNESGDPESICIAALTTGSTDTVCVF